MLYDLNAPDIAEFFDVKSRREPIPVSLRGLTHPVSFVCQFLLCLCLRHQPHAVAGNFGEFFQVRGHFVNVNAIPTDAIIDVENILRRLRLNNEAGNPKSAMQVVFDASIEVRSAVSTPH